MDCKNTFFYQNLTKDGGGYVQVEKEALEGIYDRFLTQMSLGY